MLSGEHRFNIVDASDQIVDYVTFHYSFNSRNLNVLRSLFAWIRIVGINTARKTMQMHCLAIRIHANAENGLWERKLTFAPFHNGVLLISGIRVCTFMKYLQFVIHGFVDNK